MTAIFDQFAAEFTAEIAAIGSLVTAFDDARFNPRIRVAAANSATLLIAATFEEFSREMAREYAKIVVASKRTVAELPPKLVSTAWRRTMEYLSKVGFDNNDINFGSKIRDASIMFANIYEFSSGDLSKNIYKELIKNENNMRSNEFNSLFKVSGLEDVCKKLSDKNPVLEFFGSTDPGIVHGKLVTALNDFFGRRNIIAHSLNASQSSGNQQIQNDLAMFKNCAKALCETLTAAAGEANR